MVSRSGVVGGCRDCIGHFMVRKLSPEGFYQIRDPKNFHAAMRADVELLLSKRAYLSLTTVIVCCLDALAAGSGKATRGKFESFVTKHFHGLCTALESVCRAKWRSSPSAGSCVPITYLTEPTLLEMAIFRQLWTAHCRSGTGTICRIDPAVVRFQAKQKRFQHAKCAKAFS